MPQIVFAGLVLALLIYIAIRVTPRKSSAELAAPGPIAQCSEAVPSGLVEILNRDGHCIGRRPPGHPDLAWAQSEPTVTIRVGGTT